MNAQSIPGDFVYSSALTQDVDAPVRMAVDNQDNMFVVDATGNKLKVFSPAGILVDSLMFTSSPSSVAVGDNNELFVGLGTEGRIYKKCAGCPLTEIYSGLIVPSDMTAGPDNLLYIVDSRNKRVLVIDFFGNFVRYIGSGVFYAPIGIAYDRKNSRIIVSEHGGTGNGFNLHSEIRAFSLTGTLLNTFGGYGNGNGKFYRTQGITVGRCGRIYVVDPYQGNISLFDENGTYITKFGTFGSSPDQMDIPMDVAFNSAEQVIVSVMNNGSLEFYNITDVLPSSTIVTSSKYICPGDSANILVSFTGTAPWTYTYVRNGQDPVTAVSYTNHDTIVVSQTGIYAIVALSDANTAGTCFTGAATILENPLPTASLLSDNIAICQGDSAVISVSLTGMPPWSLTYAIDGIDHATINNILHSPLDIYTDLPGTYTLTAISGGICAGNMLGGTSTVVVNPLPSPVTITNSPVCEGDLLSLACNTPGMNNFTWLGPNGFSSNAQNAVLPNATSLATGIYTLQVTDINGCTAYTSTTTFVETPPAGGEIIGGGSIYEGYSYINLSLTNYSGNIKMWQKSPDHQNWINIDISSSTLIDLPSSTGLWYYRAVVGNNTCEPVFSSEAQINVLSRSLSGKIFLQGLYRPNTGMMDKAQNENGDEFPANTADVISVSLASATPPYSIEYTFNDIELGTDGTFSFNLPAGSVFPYFIVINHRNSIETWSAIPHSFYDNVNFIDFTESNSIAFGNNLIQVGNVWTLFAGDVNQDGIVDADDMISIDNQSQVFGVGYLPEDINGDGLIDSSDLIMVDNNSSTFVSMIKP